MAKKGKNKHHKKPGFKLSIAVVAGLLPGVSRMLYHAQAGGFQGLTTEAARIYTGYDPVDGSWHMWRMWYGTYPLLLGVIVHRVASLIGINRALARAGIPFVRL